MLFGVYRTIFSRNKNLKSNKHTKHYACYLWLFLLPNTLFYYVIIVRKLDDNFNIFYNSLFNESYLWFIILFTLAYFFILAFYFGIIIVILEHFLKEELYKQTKNENIMFQILYKFQIYISGELNNCLGFTNSKLIKFHDELNNLNACSSCQFKDNNERALMESKLLI